MSDPIGRIPVVEVVEILPTKVWAEKDFFGTVHIKMQHEGEPKPFTFIQIHYDHRYTHNAHQSVLTAEILKLLGHGEQP